jgi:glutaconate CoA-transferase subunit B
VGGDHRQKLGIRTQGPTLLITDLAILRTDSVTKEWVVHSLHPGVTRQALQKQTGWALRFAEEVAETPPPDEQELEVLRDLQARTARAHQGEPSGVSRRVTP